MTAMLARQARNSIDLLALEDSAVVPSKPDGVTPSGFMASLDLLPYINTITVRVFENEGSQAVLLILQAFDNP